MSERPTWVNLVSGFLVFAGVLGLASWAFLAWFSWEKGTTDESVTGAMVTEEGDRIIATTESGEVVFEGPADEFDDLTMTGRWFHQRALVYERLLPALGMVMVGAGLWYLVPVVEERKDELV